MGIKPRLSASVRWNEIVVDDGETIWTIGATGGSSTVDDDPAVYKVGAKSAELILHADATVGIVSYSAGAFANNDLSDYTHVAYWVRSTIALAAGDFQLGFSDAADQTGTEYYLNIPALATVNTWTRVYTSLSDGDDPGANVSSASSVHLKMAVDKAAGSIFIDDIRLVNLQTFPSTNGIEVEAASTLGNTNAVTGTTPNVFVFPFTANRVSTNELPVDATITWYYGTPGVWSANDVVQGSMNYTTADRLTDVEVTATACSIVLGSDMGAADYIELMVQE